MKHPHGKPAWPTGVTRCHAADCATARNPALARIRWQVMAVTVRTFEELQRAIPTSDL
jgi:hypothetical protein